MCDEGAKPAVTRSRLPGGTFRVAPSGPASGAATGPDASTFTRQGPPPALAGRHLPTRSSAELCRQALAAYARLFTRVHELEPDLGLGERYSCGRRAIEARARAIEWQLEPRAHTLAQHLVAELAETGEADVVELLDAFPTGFLRAIERRQSRDGARGLHRRRFEDRLAERPADVH